MEKILLYWHKLRAQFSLNQWLLVCVITGFGLFGYCCIRFGFLQVLRILLLIAFIMACGYGLYLLVRYCQKNPHKMSRAYFEKVIRSFDGKLKAVKHLTLFQRKAQAADLPWFLLCGTSQSGKSSLLKQSNISFSQTQDSHLKLDHDLALWFADEAVVIDTQDAAWDKIMRQIKRLKAQTKLKGILLTIACDQLLQGPGNDGFLDKLRAQIDTIYRQTGRQLPIYMILTKLDVLNGFAAMFSQYDNQATQNAFGFVCDRTASMHEQLERELKTLNQKLLGRFINQMHVMPDKAAKLAGFVFLNDFRQLTAKLQQQIEALQQKNMYQEALQFKGVYFTSAEQNNSSNKAYFIHQLLIQHIFSQKETVPLTQAKYKQNLWFCRGQRLTFVLGCCSVFLLVVFAYHRQVELLNQSKLIAQQGRDLMRHSASQQAQYAYLETVAHHIDQLRHFKRDHAWYQRLGFYKQQAPLEKFERLLASVLNQTLYHPAQHFLTQELAHKHQQWSKADEAQRAALRGAYYTQLKLHLMLNFPKYLDTSFAQIELEKIWHKLRKKNVATSSNNTLSTQAMIESYLDYLKHCADEAQAKRTHIHADIIRLARLDLKTSSGVSNLYASMMHQNINRFGILDEHDFFDEDNMDVWRVGQPISKFFTQETYLKFVKPQFLRAARRNPKQDWVIHAPLAVLKNASKFYKEAPASDDVFEKYLKEFHTDYFNHYFATWLHGIASIKMVSFTSYEDAAQQLRLLYQASGAFQKLFASVHQNMELSSMIETKTYQRLPEYLRHRFTAIERFTQSAPQKIQFEPYLKQLAVLQQDIERLYIGGHLSDEAEHYALRVLNDQGEHSELSKTTQKVDQLVNDFNDLYTRQALRKLFLSPVQEAYRAVLYEMVRGLQQEWQQNVVATYKEKIMSHFPFNRSGPDVDLTQFSTFFKPKNGTFAQFLNRIKPFLIKKGNDYTSRSWLGVTLPLPNAFLQQLGLFEQISNSLFASSDEELSLKFMIYPIPTPGIQEILFVSNGQSYPYRNGPQEWVSLKWPKQDTMDNETFIRITHAQKNRQSLKEFQGTWGLFHLLMSADEIVKTQRGYRVKWLFKGQGDVKAVQMLVASKTQQDPFQALLFKPPKMSENIIDYS